MKEKWITAEDIIQQGIMNEATLVTAVGNGELTAYNKKWQPINIRAAEEQFNEIIKLSKQTIQKQVLRTRVIHPGLNKNFEYIKGFDPYEIIEISILRVWPDDKKSRISWDELYKGLSDKYGQIAIPQSQYNEITRGWGYDQVKEIVSNSIFKRDDLPFEVTSELNIGKKQEEELIISWKMIEKTAGRSRKVLQVAAKQLRKGLIFRKIGGKVAVNKSALLGLVESWDGHPSKKNSHNTAG